MISHLIRQIPVLNEQQCSQILTAAKNVPLRRTTVFGTKGEELVSDDIRNNTMINVDDNVDHKVTKMINDAVMNALLDYRDQVYQFHFAYNGWPMPEVGYTEYKREKFQLLSYVEDQHYTWHFDQSVVKSSAEYDRQLSMVLYLTDDFDGGYTWFPYTKYKPRVGEALFFPSNWCFPHCSEKVTRGDKRVIVTWFQVKYTPTDGSVKDDVTEE